jgi:hypothetical protein
MKLKKVLIRIKISAKIEEIKLVLKFINLIYNKNK